jgi:hypothetical protein
VTPAILALLVAAFGVSLLRGAAPVWPTGRQLVSVGACRSLARQLAPWIAKARAP